MRVCVVCVCVCVCVSVCVDVNKADLSAMESRTVPDSLLTKNA
jgi:hypothetical protein